MIKHGLSALAVTFVLLMLMQSTIAESSSILTCTISGDPKLGKRVVKLTVVPPKSNERFNLWALTEEHEPETLIKQAVGVGRVQVDYGRHTEQSDLIFLRVGNENGSSHVAFWLRGGVFQHPNFIIIDVWESDIPIHLMESVEPQPYLTGNCSR